MDPSSCDSICRLSRSIPSHPFTPDLLSSTTLSSIGTLVLAISVLAHVALLYFRTRPPIGIVTELVIYPVKSCAGLRVPRARVLPHGLEHDRVFLVVDASGSMLTQRTHPHMARVQPTLAEDGALVVSAPGVSELVLPRAAFDGGRAVKAYVHGNVCAGRDMGDAAAAFFAQAVGEETARLLRMAEGGARTVQLPRRSKVHNVVPEDSLKVSFADGFPFLVASESSLEAVREMTQRPQLGMARFRPNIVVSGDALQAFAEDAWDTLTIGSKAHFQVAKMCTRCQVPRIDQSTGVSEKAEPTASMRKFRSFRNAVVFGQNLLAKNHGNYITVGDKVCVTLKKPDVPDHML